MGSFHAIPVYIFHQASMQSIKIFIYMLQLIPRNIAMQYIFLEALILKLCSEYLFYDVLYMVDACFCELLLFIDNVWKL